MQQALIKYANRKDKNLAAIGIDTWGVVMDCWIKTGNSLGNPYHYRDSRTEGIGWKKPLRGYLKRKSLKRPV